MRLRRCRGGGSREIEEEEKIEDNDNGMGQYGLFGFIKVIIDRRVCNSLLIYIAPLYLSPFSPSGAVAPKVSVPCYFYTLSPPRLIT